MATLITMTRHLAPAASSATEELRKLATSRRCDSASTALLSQLPPQRNNNIDRRRRERACRSWACTYGYGTLVEDASPVRRTLPAVHSTASVTTPAAADIATNRPRIDPWPMPSLKSLVSRRSGARSDATTSSPAAMVPLVRQPSCSSLSPLPGGGIDATPIRKCETAVALSNLLSTSRNTLHVEPLKPVNRLRVPGGSSSRMCSRCSSLLSMASSSRYSLNTAGGGFVQCPSPSPVQEYILCKLCLTDVTLSSTCQIVQCGCLFCTDCMKAYVEFEIQEGAYDISCPDAQCEKQGVISLSEIELLVTPQLMDKHKMFRLNREVDLDQTRTWCPRAGCETVCDVCPTERCQPQSVHCPTCSSDFCSNCKNPWHTGLSCEENNKRLSKDAEPGIPFDSDLIKCCPMCNVPIEKDEGCAQMMCKRCKHVFCWYCLASLDDDFLLRHYDKGPCKNKLGHSRASVIWHRTQVIGIFAGFGILLLVASPLLLLAAPCIVCCKCRVCTSGKLEPDEDLADDSSS